MRRRVRVASVRARAALRVVVGLALALAATAALAQGSVPLVPGPHDALTPAGAQADHIGRLWNVFLGVCSGVTLAIFVVFAIAIWKTPRADAGTPADLSSLGRHERGPYRSVAWGVGISTVLLVVLLAASVWTDRALARLPLGQALNIEVTGHQWWWSATYEGSADEPLGQSFSTANELHVPAGRPVIVTLHADDVIHSLWVPNLAGKKDLIPGRTAELRFRADKPGRYRGQCAEFCGFQHAYMAFQVIVDEPAAYEAWAARQREEAPAPSDPRLVRGRDVFVGSTCVMCHTVQGTTASARKGPDLTHVGGRTTLAAGTLMNTPEDLKRWIRDPQQVKPGSNMPASTLSDADLDALVAWLRSLT